MTTPRTLHDTHCADLHCKYMQKYTQIHPNTQTHKYLQTLKYKTQKNYPVTHIALCSGQWSIARRAYLGAGKSHAPMGSLWWGKCFPYNWKCFQYRFGLSNMMPFSKKSVIASGCTLVPILSIATESLYLYPILVLNGKRFVEHE